MTLTQVSTWFANARRRLKKENGLKEDTTDESLDDKGNFLLFLLNLSRRFIKNNNETQIWPKKNILKFCLRRVRRVKIRSSNKYRTNRSCHTFVSERTRVT